MAYQAPKTTNNTVVAFDNSQPAPVLTQGKIRSCRGFLRFLQRLTSQSVKYDASFFGKGICHSLGISLELEITHNLPLSYRKGIRTTAGGVQSPPLSSWFISGKPLLVKVSGKARSAWEDNFVSHGYRNMAVHGLIDERTGRMSIFGFYNYQSESDGAMMELLNNIAMVTHDALHAIPQTIEREFHIVESKEATALTEREEEIIYWVSQGKTNADIALILGISSNTVRNHLYNASEKLSASNRTELVSFVAQRFAS
ncbi:TPA: helix-turn-helix transcriptional regulator [Pseudomonas aeruginosa]